MIRRYFTLSLFCISSICLASWWSFVSAPRFSNDHSLSLDSDGHTYIDMGNVAPFTTLDYNTSSCVSVWFKVGTICTGYWASNAACQVTLLSKQNQNIAGTLLGIGWTWLFDNSPIGNPRLQVFQDVTHYFDERTTSAFDDNRWHNVIWSYDGTPSDGHAVITVDGSARGLQNLSVGVPNASVLPTQNTVPMIFGAAPLIASEGGGADYFGTAKLAQFAYWQGQSCSGPMRTALYNGGVPGDLTSISPQIWYQFSLKLVPPDNPSGTIYDRGSAHVNGTAHGAVSFTTDVPQPPPPAFSHHSIALNGSSQYVSVPASAAFALGTSVTISAWVNPSTVTGVGGSGHGVVEDFTPSPDSFGFLFSLGFETAGLMSFYGGNSSSQASVSDTASLTPNIWTHIAETYDGANVKFYIDGTLSSTKALTKTIGDNAAQELHIGASTNSPINRYFAGLIDEVSVYSVPLSGSDITTIYNGGRPGDLALGPQYSNQVAWWRFENDATDVHGAHNGTLQGSPSYSADVP